MATWMATRFASLKPNDSNWKKKKADVDMIQIWDQCPTHSNILGF